MTVVHSFLWILRTVLLQTLCLDKVLFNVVIWSTLLEVEWCTRNKILYRHASHQNGSLSAERSNEIEVHAENSIVDLRILSDYNSQKCNTLKTKELGT